MLHGARVYWPPEQLLLLQNMVLTMIGVDINPNVVEMTNEGKLHIVEPGLESFLQDVIHTQKIESPR